MEYGYDEKENLLSLIFICFLFLILFQGLVLCQIWLSVDFTASTASIFNLLTLSLDRYWSITSPLQYLGKRTRARALVLIGFAWGLSLLWVIPIFGWHRLVNNGTRYIDVNDFFRFFLIRFLIVSFDLLVRQMRTRIYALESVQSLDCDH